jgi:hypothetical protein
LIAVALKVTEVPAQIVVAEAPMIVDGVTDGLTVIVMVFEVAAVGEAQLSEVVIIQLTLSLLARPVVL